MKGATIFVFVPSYRDSETVHTVQCLLDTAADATRVHVNVFLQGDEPFDVEAPNVVVRRVPAEEARGPCVARAQALSMYRDEDYVLWLDSHMRMVRHWDSLLIALLDACPSSKPVLTTYPAGYERPSTVQQHWSDAVLDADARAPFLVLSGFGPSDGMMRFKGRRLRERPAAPLPCSFWVSGFSFSHGAMVREVPYDARLEFLFFGEETSMTLRLYTHGYDFYCPPVHVCYHLWQRSYRPTFREVKLPNARHERLERVARARVRLQLQLPLREDDGLSHDELEEASSRLDHLGLGSARTLASYEQLTGIHLAARSAEERAYRGGLSEEALVGDDDHRMQQVLSLLQGNAAFRGALTSAAATTRTTTTTTMPSLEAVLRVARVQITDALTCVVWGSRVYGTVDAASDWDFLVVAANRDDHDNDDDDGDEVTRKGDGMDVSVYSETQWRHLLRTHDVAALETLWVAERFVLLSRVDWRAIFELNAETLRRAFSAEAANSWVKAKKKLTVEKDFAPRVARKSLFHALRILEFGRQIGASGRIEDYSACNDVWRQVMAQQSDEWEVYSQAFKARYNAARSAFKRVAPLPVATKNRK